MRGPLKVQWLIVAAIAGAVALADHASAGQSELRAGGGPPWKAPVPATRNAYDIGYREGAARGELDARDGFEFNYDRNSTYRSAELGYDKKLGTKDAFRTDFRRGFAAGYRTSYERTASRRDDRWGRRPPPRGYQEPAVARGYSEGYDKGLDDGKDHDRYDPVRHSDYRDADEGYKREYGSKDAYKNNYRAGFRQGYEDGYRDGTRRR